MTVSVDSVKSRMAELLDHDRAVAEHHPQIPALGRVRDARKCRSGRASLMTIPSGGSTLPKVMSGHVNYQIP